MNHKFILIISFLVSFPIFAQARELPNFTDLVDEHGAAVVNISTVQTHTKSRNQIFPRIPNFPENSPFYEFFRRHSPHEFSPRDQLPEAPESRSLGSGFIISSDGYILTNAHVVNSADEITVKLNDKREFPAKIIGADRKTDIALIKIEANNLPKVTQGDPDNLKVGEWVIAIGSPFGFENSVTAGIVSAKGRSLAQENYVPFIQTDVAINPGNSGGPLFNLKGEVVGINSQIYSRTGGYMGLSFAIPIDVATDISNQLKATGKVSRGRIGVMIQEVTKELAESFGLNEPSGALVTLVQKGGPADKAGLKAKDIIIKFDGKVVKMSSDLPRIVGSTKPGTEVLIQVWRNNAKKKLTVQVEEFPADEKIASLANKNNDKSNAYNLLGLVLREFSKGEKRQFEINHGLLVESMKQGVASSSGIRPNDIILGINNQDVTTVENFNQLLRKIKDGRNIALLIRRGSTTFFVTMKLNGEKDK
ncbi:MAG: protease Do [Nitrosomonadaceae bacterium]|nr:protease Do [Nitrosomonadaceae bacterium]|tara:strand:- start:12294 stop:13724 length:1431 start_codon:yes stop_codon:yes gene_type:complete